LPGVGEKSDHRESDEGTHSAGVVVTGETVIGGGEEGGDVEVGAESGESGAPGVVVLVDGEEGGLVADVGYVFVVEVVEAFDEGGGAAESGD
jgi:hypothetical protein